MKIKEPAILKDMSAKVTFLNQPKLSEFDVDKERNEKRLALVPQVEKFILGHNLFKEKEVSVTFAHRGVSSLVSIMESSNQKFVLKIPLSKALGEGEGQFLRVWETAGVKVPHVFDIGKIGDHYFTLMEFINAPTVNEAYPDSKVLLKTDKYAEMGKMFCLMHMPKSRGYGRVVDGHAEFDSFEDWLRKSPEIQERLKYVKEHSLLDENKHGSIEAAFKILIDKVGTDGKSSYCHFDFGGGNMFATEPITVFDPWPRFNDKYIDLGRCVVQHLSHGLDAETEQLKKGYFDDEPCDERALQAAVLINAYMKFPYQHQTQKKGNIENMKVRLAQNKAILVS